MPTQPTGVVTLMFTDIEGSTRLLDRVGTERYAAALHLHRRLLQEAFERFDGYEVACDGDAFFVAFESAENAVAAAARAQHALDGAEWDPDVEIRVRMGIHTGEPLAVQQNYVGLDVHRAARIMAAGHGGQVLISHATAGLLGGRLDLRDLGEHRLKDLLQPEPLYELRIEGVARDFPPLRTLGNRPNNLPVQPNPLIGRERDLGELTALVRGGGRLVTLTAPGGSGKTRLALQLAADLLGDFRSGTFFVALDRTREPALVVPAVADALGVREVPGESLLTTIADYLRDKEMLLVLDNFEQVVEAAPALADLLAAAPGLRIVSTSRRRLGLSGEHEYPVPPLLLEAAVELFVERARCLQPAFAPDDDVWEIARRLDGLPLALELAAARTKVLTSTQICERLGRSLDLLTGGMRDAPERQQTLRATIASSFEMLDASEMRAFARLAVFSGGFDIAAAEEGADVHLDTVQGLVDKSLVRSETGRFRMLETVREYASERLLADAFVDEAARRHASYFAGLASEGVPLLDGTEGAEWRRRFSDETDNFRSALAWLDAHDRVTALRLAESLWRFWVGRGHLREAEHWFDKLLSPDELIPPELLADALQGAAVVAVGRGDLELARARFERSLELRRHLGEERKVGVALTNLAGLEELEGNLGSAEHLRLQAIEIFARDGNNANLMRSIIGLGNVQMKGGKLEAARSSFEQAGERARLLSNEWGVAASLACLGCVALRAGDAEPATRQLLEALRALHGLGDRASTSDVLAELAHAAILTGDHERAARLAGACDAMCEQDGRAYETLPRAELERALGAARYLELHTCGSKLTTDELIEFAEGSTYSRSL